MCERKPTNLSGLTVDLLFWERSDEGEDLPHIVVMSDSDGNGVKGNAGEFGEYASSGASGGLRKPRGKRKRRARAHDDGHVKVILALIMGAGGAFLLALLLLMSRLETDEASNGLLNSNVGGVAGVDDAIAAEEGGGGLRPDASQGERQRAREGRIVSQLHSMRRAYGEKAKKIERMFNLPEDHPFDRLMNEGVKELGQIERAAGGKGDMPKRHDLGKEFRADLEAAKEKEAKARKDHRAKKEAPPDSADRPPHLYPKFPPMPPHTMAVDLFGESIITDTLSHDKPTIAGVIAILQRFLGNLHAMLKARRDAKTPDEVIEAYFGLVNEYLEPLEHAYRDRSVFPIREDGSIFMSLGAYRDHLLGETLRQAFKNAASPDKLFIGAVVQNCFGIDVQCRTGVEVKGKDKQGRPVTEISDRPPDHNGIEEFCGDPGYVQYCDSGQVRVLYVNETESNGPTTARYFASKLWGGETYFMQSDAHLRFAPEWDRLYIEEVKAAKSYPKAILSSYPPGFNEGDPPYQGGSTGTRLCTCTFSDSDVEHKILRINTGNSCHGPDGAPTQIAYIAAGFFFARGEFLVDVPFDPFLPWCFMGEEIALSLRAWTHGWDIYAPRKNLIAHQYRPGRMGLPKFWENTGRVFGRPGPGFNTKLQTITIQRIKYMVGYTESTQEELQKHDWNVVLTDFEHYGPGDVRSMKEFLEHTSIDVKNYRCGHIGWCNDCSLP